MNNEDKKSKKRYLYDDSVLLTKYAKKKFKKNVTQAQVNKKIFPEYSYLFSKLLFFIFYS